MPSKWLFNGPVSSQAMHLQLKKGELEPCPSSGPAWASRGEYGLGMAAKQRVEEPASTHPGEREFPPPTSNPAQELRVFPAQEGSSGHRIGALQVNEHVSAARLFYGDAGKLQLKQMDPPSLSQHLGQGAPRAGLGLG